MENLDLPSTNSKMGNGTFCSSLAFFLVFLFGGGGGEWRWGCGGAFAVPFYSKIVDCLGSAILVTYCTLKTRWKYDRPPTDHRKKKSRSKSFLQSCQVSNSRRTWKQKISWTHRFRDRSPRKVVGGILNDMQKCFHAIFFSTSFSFFCISLHHSCF